MPQVKLTPASVFDRAKLPGSIAQKRGVICKLRCCGCQLDQKCNELTGDAACPTHVEAARRLRAKVAEQHGSAACLEKAEQKLAEEGSGSRGPVESAFSPPSCSSDPFHNVVLNPLLITFLNPIPQALP